MPPSSHTRSRTIPTLQALDPSKQSLVDLAAETRNAIYRHAMSNGDEPTFSYKKYHECSQKKATPDQHGAFIVPKALLQTCKAIRREALPIYFAINTFGMGQPTDMMLLRQQAGHYLSLITKLHLMKDCVINDRRLKQLSQLRGLKVISFFTWVNVVNASGGSYGCERGARRDIKRILPQLENLLLQKPGLKCTVKIWGPLGVSKIKDSSREVLY